MEPMLKIEDVVEKTSLGKSTLEKMIENGEFPKPLKLGPRTRRWHAEDINKWINDLPAVEKPIKRRSVKWK